MMRSVIYTLLDAAAPRAIASSTDASPIVVKSAANHGLVTGDKVQVIGHTTNTNANGTWTVTKVDDDNFSLDGSTGTGAGAGGADGTFYKVVNPIIDTQDYTNFVFTYDTDGGADAAATCKFASGQLETAPDLAKVQSVTNQYDFIDVIDLEDGTSIDGDTGIAVAGADDHRQVEGNVNAAKWMGAVITEGTEGELTVKLRLFNHH